MQIIEQFIQYLKTKKDASPQTIKAYTSDIKKFVKWYIETEGEPPDFKVVGVMDMAEFKRYLMNKNQKPATINRAIISLSAFFEWLGTDNPAKNIKLLPETKPAPKALERKQVLALFRAVQASGKTRDIAIITLLLHTGIRVSELCLLQTEDIVINPRSGYLTVRFGKGNKRREVPLNPTARNALEKWLLERGDVHGKLFIGKSTSSLTTRAVEYMIKKYADRAKLENVSPHTLRHTFCKNLVDNGEPLSRVAMLAGHKNIDTTAKYSTPTAKDLQTTVDKIAWE